MKIKQFHMNNLLKITLDKKQIKEFNILAVEKELLSSNIFISGPTVMHQKTDRGQHSFDYYIPVNDKVVVPEGAAYTFVETISHEKCAYLRIHDLDVETVKREVLDFKNDIEKNLFMIVGAPFEIMLPVYGGGMLDMYQPLNEEVGF